MAVGDVMLDRGVANRIKANSPDYPYEKIKKIIEKDIEDNYITSFNYGD